MDFTEVKMKVYRDGTTPTLVETKLVSSQKQAMYFIQAYRDECVYGEITIDDQPYIVGADCVEPAF